MKAVSLIFVIITLCAYNILAQPFNTQVEWETYFKNRIKDLNPIEGIWSLSSTAKLFNYNNTYNNKQYFPQASKEVIYKSGNKYLRYTLNEDNSNFQISFNATASQGIYLMECYYKKSYSTSKANATLKNNSLLEYAYEVPSEEVDRRVNSGEIYNGHKGIRLILELQLIKIFPTSLDYDINQISSGSGFSVSSNGIIVTNYHVIDGASSIKVRGINSDFNKAYKAKVLVSDKNNDLALIQIDDLAFTSIESIPYTIKTSLAGVGENIFVLGYPLRATMGDEIKLTNGIISSKTGFQGDITSYQVSAPIQPGNSGGPLFNSQGDIIGIVNAKHAGAENASYAIKSNFLMNLIELLDSPPIIQKISTVNGKTLPQQVDLVKKFIYIIEVN